jgi:proline iminopeptidase
MRAPFSSDPPSPRESMIPVENAELFCREVGQGQPIIVLHGGISLDHTYLLPDMDRLSDAYRLIYFDQRGRGKSIGDVANISIQSELEDLEGLRRHLGLDSVAVLGHSWGGYLAMEYALRHPQRVSHLILLHTAPASREGYLLYAQEWAKRRVPHEEKLAALMASARYTAGDPRVVAEFCRIYFGAAIKQPEHLARVNLSF